MQCLQSLVLSGVIQPGTDIEIDLAELVSSTARSVFSMVDGHTPSNANLTMSAEKQKVLAEICDGSPNKVMRHVTDAVLAYI